MRRFKSFHPAIEGIAAVGAEEAWSGTPLSSFAWRSVTWQDTQVPLLVKSETLFMKKSCPACWLGVRWLESIRTGFGGYVT